MNFPPQCTPLDAIVWARRRGRPHASLSPFLTFPDGALTLLGGVGTLGKLVMHFPKLTLVEVCNDPRTG